MIAPRASRFAGGGVCRRAIAPVTRGCTAGWKSGIFHPTRAVDAPLALAMIDYARREIGAGVYVALNGDVDADMARLAAYDADKRGRRPGNAGPARLAVTEDQPLRASPRAV